MENKEFNLGKYLTGGVEGIVKEAVRATLTNPKESMFMAQFAMASREEYPDIVFISFPGDEKSSGGCVLFEWKESVEAILAESAGKIVSVSSVG